MMSEIGGNGPPRLKTGGRQKGTPNRVTTDVREAFADLLRGNLDNVQRWLDRVAQDNPAKALELMLQLSRYVLPELKAVAVEVRPPPRDVRRLSMAELQRIVAEAEEPERLPPPSIDCADLLGDITY